MQPYPAPHFGWNTVAVILVVIAIVLWRSLRPQRMSVGRLFFTPFLFLVIVVVSVYSGVQFFRITPWEVVVALVAGALAGIPVGLLRGRHTNVRTTDRRNVMILDASWKTVAIYFGAFILRFLIRLAVPPSSPAGYAIGDGVIAFAASMIVVSYYVIYMKFKALEARATTTLSP